MNGTMKLVAPLVAALAIAACSSGNSSNVPTGGSQTVGSPSTRIPQWQARHLARATCPQVVGKPSCFALQIIGKNGQPPPCNPTSTCGFTATQLESAYGLGAFVRNAEREPRSRSSRRATSLAPRRISRRTAPSTASERPASSSTTRPDSNPTIRRRVKTTAGASRPPSTSKWSPPRARSARSI